MQIPEIKKIVEKTLNQNKAVNIVSINLKGKTSTDYMVIPRAHHPDIFNHFQKYY